MWVTRMYGWKEAEGGGGRHTELRAASSANLAVTSMSGSNFLRFPTFPGDSSSSRSPERTSSDHSSDPENISRSGAGIWPPLSWASRSLFFFSA